MMDLWRAIGLLAWNAILFFMLGRWSVHRTAAHRMGHRILDDITQILDKRHIVGDNADGMVITNTRGWSAFGYEWKISIVQEKSIGHRTGSSA